MTSSDPRKDPRVQCAFEALLMGHKVAVITASRHFTGLVLELYRSLYGNHIGARVVLNDGRVEHFKVTARDAEVTQL